jgi:eukaryotic-like serine/threonine-protein kinase
MRWSALKALHVDQEAPTLGEEAEDQPARRFKGDFRGSTPDDRSGEILDSRYRLIRQIGHGGVGTVYEGMHMVTGRRVAVKLLLPSALSDPRCVVRFYREARAATAIHSERICEVLDMRPLGQGEPFLVMEYLDGEPLSKLLARESLQVSAATGIARQVLVGLAAAHEAGIIHRDIKPGNIFLVQASGDRLEVKLVDFGVSKSATDGIGSRKLTERGMSVGTPRYMSPEQARGEAGLGPKTDIFAVGVVLYESLTGKRPFDGSRFHEIVAKLMRGSPVPPRSIRPSLPVELEEIVLKALALDPAERFDTAWEMAAALEAFCAEPLSSALIAQRG